VASKFELRVEPRRNNQLMVSVFQYPNSRGRRKERTPQEIVRLWGLPLQAAREEMLELLQQAGHRLTAFKPTGSRPLRLPEDLGIRLGLLSMALKPLRKLERMREIQRGVEEMSREEATYWFSKAGGAERYNDRRRIMKAMRILLSPE